MPLWSLTGANEEEHSTPYFLKANQKRPAYLEWVTNRTVGLNVENLTSGPPLRLPGLGKETRRSFKTATTGARIRRPAEVLFQFLMGSNQRPTLTW